MSERPDHAPETTPLGEPSSEFFERIRGRGAAGWKEWLQTCGDRAAAIPFSQHLEVYQAVYGPAALRENPMPVWIPEAPDLERAHVTQWCLRHECDSVDDLHAWSVREREAFWQEAIQELGIVFQQPPRAVWDTSSSLASPEYLPGAQWNVAASCFQGDLDRPAIHYADEEGRSETWSLERLLEEVRRVAGALAAQGFGRGSRAAIMMPMTPEAVAIYLGVIWAGGAVVAIADSFAAPEVATRLEIGGAEVLFVQGAYHRAGKEIDLYRRVLEVNVPPCIVVGETTLQRAEDRSYASWRNDATPLVDPVMCSSMEVTNYLFSSGTTGTPKAIPWSHATPIKCATDARLHQDVHSGDVLAWPTNLGWMMGPWLIYAALVNRASMALYGGSPGTREFGRFVEKAGVTMLGVVPSLVRAWRENGAIEGLDWSRIRCFSSTGECSQPEDMFYLMSRAGFRPVIEYCGGTELAGGYISSTVVVPCAPSVFTLPTFGLDFVILDEEGNETDCGEVFLIPPSLGLSTSLLNRDHDEAYFAGVPAGPHGELLRRHGDLVERLDSGRFRVLGRADDTMNLGGIKVSSAEIERVVAELEGIREAAAVAVPPPGGGPAELVVFVVLQGESPSDESQWFAVVRRHIAGQLNPLFKLQRLVIVDSLPRTASNKVMRRLLRQRAAEERGA